MYVLQILALLYNSCLPKYNGTPCNTSIITWHHIECGNDNCTLQIRLWAHKGHFEACHHLWNMEYLFEHFGEKILFGCYCHAHFGLNCHNICDLSFRMHFSMVEQLRLLLQQKYRSMLHFYLNHNVRYHTIVNPIIVITNKPCNTVWSVTRCIFPLLIL